ncbi:c-type cytochrome [Sphingomonas sp. GC_Shp_3]|uniref:c-type cytochrome n=1 Tax=Sphingomonas sp. GC_Shp_3 TaxID=2937383 RepID=UPI00226A3988|nr:c-type cytochrome [Sphingomonas sp. GC_Shp_3]
MATLFGLIALAGCGPRVEHDPRLANAPLPERLAAADPRAGSAIFAQCAACHSIAQGTGDRAGPNLYAVPGRAIAQGSPNFNYSAALRSIGGVWTFDRLDAWLTSPAHFAPRTNMMFAGLNDGMDRADVIRFLNDNGSKLPLPPVVSQRTRPDR